MCVGMCGAWFQILGQVHMEYVGVQKPRNAKGVTKWKLNMEDYRMLQRKMVQYNSGQEPPTGDDVLASNHTQERESRRARREARTR